ncbi:MAG: hypothetical protein ABH952_00725 [Candidatus Omnitrophota bacterium]
MKFTEEAQKVVFIFGNGASRSIGEDVPLMYDFFGQIANYLKENDAIKKYKEF